MKSAALFALAAIVAVCGAPRAAGADPGRDLLAETDAIAKQVAGLRGLAIKQPIKRGIKNRAEIRASVLKNIDRLTTDEEIAIEERVLKRLGMLPAAADYKALYVDVATEQIAGFYDPWEKELYIAEGVELAATAAALDDGPMVMAHEVVHALQDQHFDLRKFMGAVANTNADAAVARQALAEGDGMALMIEFMFARVGSDPPWGDPKVTRELERAFDGSAEIDSLAKVPLFMRVGMLFPYAGGLRFIMRYRRHHPWARIDSMYTKPPLSTEHILHPKKYSRYERPDEITERAPTALADHRRVYHNVTGELGFSTLLQQHGVDAATAATAAAGWGGDRIVMYAPSEDPGSIDSAVVVSYSVWDDEADAIEIFDAMTAALGVLAGSEATTQSDTLAVYRDASGDVSSVQRDGDAVVMIVGAPAAAAEAMREQIPKTWKIRRR